MSDTGPGRPLKYGNVEELESAINDYFASCKDVEGRYIKPVTITGLALALDTTRKTLIEYEARDEYVNAIKRAKTRIENFAEERLFTATSAAGPIFALKNFGWKDSIDQNIGGQSNNPLKADVNITLTAEEAYRRMLDADT